MHLDGLIERIWRFTWRPRSSELRDALGGHYRSRLEMYMEAFDQEPIDVEAVDLEAVDLEAVDLEAVDREVCVMQAETLFID